MSYTPPPSIEIEFSCENEEQLEHYKPRLLEIREKFLYKPWNDYTKAELQFEILCLEHYIKDHEKPLGHNIKVGLTGPAAYNNATWSLHDILSYYKYYYPERYEDKETYTRIDVNNILFDLKIKGVIDGYEWVALPYSIAEKHNNEQFPEWKTISVLEKYNIKKK